MNAETDVVAHLASDVSAAAKSVVAAARSYAAGVDLLKGPLEADVQEASEACWTVDARMIQVKSKMLVSFRTRQVKVMVPDFIAEAEQQLLGAALKQWQTSAEGVVASSILEVKVAEQRMIHAVYRLLQEADSNAASMLTLLDTMLTSAADFNPVLAARCPTAGHTVRQLALYAGQKFLDSDSSAADKLGAPQQLIAVLQQHPDQAVWSAALLQISVEQLPGVLPSVLNTDLETKPAAESESSQLGDGAGPLTACRALFAQLPWEDIAQLDADIIRTDVQMPLITFLQYLAPKAADGDADAGDLMQSSVTALLLVALKVSELKVEVHAALHVGILAIAAAEPVKATLDRLGGSSKGLADASLLAWTQAAWVSPSNGKSNEGKAGSAVAAALVQRLDWRELAFSLPGKLGSRALLTLTAVAAAVLDSTNERAKQQFLSWLWHLLLSPAGNALVKIDTDEDLESVQKLCLEKGPDRDDAVRAVWTWTRMHLAVGLVEHWARSADLSQAVQQAETLLKDMDFVGLPHVLASFGQSEAVLLILMRFVEAAAALSDAFFRQQVAGVARALGPSLQAPAHGGSPSGVLPIRHNLQKLIKRGIAVNDATNTPSQTSPNSSPPQTPRTPAPSQRGSTTSPGQETLATSARWLTILVCCHHNSSIAADGLALISNLVQLLYYHGSGVAQSKRHQDEDNESVHLLSPVVQECMESVVRAVGMQAVQSLWRPLMQLAASNPKQLQWLAVLACWLSNTVHRPDASRPEHPESGSHGTLAQEALQTADPQDGPIPASAGPHTSVSAVTATDASGSPNKHAQTSARAADTDAAPKSDYPGPPGTASAATPDQDSIPPPSYEQVMQAGQQSDKSKAHHASEAVTGRAAGRSPAHGSSAQHSSGASTGAAVGTQAQQLASLAAIDRSAEEALQIQEAAVGIGYGAAALELWEEFVIRFFKYETQLGPVVPKQHIANHLQQLAHLYESSSPVLSNIYALLSCLSPDQLPGGTLRFVAENQEALRALMQLHPLSLTKLDSTAVSQPSSPNPLLDTNPFGAVPLSALLQAPAGESPRKGSQGGSLEGSRGGSPRKQASKVRGAAGHTTTVFTAGAQQSNQADEEERQQDELEPSMFQRLAAVPTSTFQDLINQQESMEEENSTQRAALRPWARRAEKQAARSSSPGPGHHRRTSPARHQPGADLQSSGGLGRQFSGSSVGSPTSTGERGLQSWLARSSRDGDVPELISQAQGKLWELTSAWTEDLERIHATMRELVCRRYKHPDLDKVANGEAGDVDEVQPQEDPTYRQHLASLRQEALKVVLDFTGNSGLLQVARLLYQLEVLLLQAAATSHKADRDDAEAAAESKCQLLLVVAEVTLDGSTPPLCTPLLATLFCQAASGAVPINSQTKVKLCRRILRALASNSQPQQQEREAVTLLRPCLDPDTLLTTPSLRDFEACLDTVLFHSHRLLPVTVTSLLGCFHLPQYANRLLEEDSDADTSQGVDGEAGVSGWPRNETAKAPAGVTKVLNLALATLSLKGGAATGGQVLQGLLVTAPAAYYAAVVQLAVTAEEEEGRQAAVAALEQIPAQALPLAVVLDSLLQVAEALNSNRVAPPHLPQVVLHHLLQAPALLAALRSMIAGAAPPAGKDDSTKPLWSAKVGSTRTDNEDGPGAGSSQISTVSEGEPKQAVLLIPVHTTAGAGECVQHLIGAWLQSILRKYGSGLEGEAFTQEFTCLLSSLLEPAGSHPWLVDWLWTVYQSVLQPFLALAGPASDGTAVTRFREYWQSLPWHKATFHCISPDALADLASLLFSSDRALLQLLHVLDWRPVLQQLSPVAASLHPTPSTPPSADPPSLLDDDATMHQGNATAAQSKASQQGGSGQMQQLDAVAKAWATQLLLLVLEAYVVMSDADMPEWIMRLVNGDEQTADAAGSDEPHNLWLTSHLRLDHVFAAAELNTLQQTLSKPGPSGAPFLLQPFVTAPHLVEGNPNLRLLTLARLLTHGAKLNGSAKAAAVAAGAVQQVMLISVCRGFHIEEGSHDEAEAPMEMLECWHLSADQLASLMQECLLPLAHMHASLGLAQSLEPAGAPSIAPKPSALPDTTPKWHAPALSSLVSRLTQPPGKGTTQPGSPSRGPQRQDDQVYLDPSSSDEEEQGPAASAVQQAGDSGANDGLSIYSVAAEPFRALLACITQPPGVLVTLEPLPFANAEGPLQLITAPRTSVGQSAKLSHHAEQPTATTQLVHDQSPAKHPGSESSMLRLRAGVAALKKGIGMGSADPKGTKLPHAAAATDAAAIQHRLALAILDSARQQHPEFALSLLRVIFTSNPLSQAPIPSALTEDLLLTQQLRQHGALQQSPGGAAASSPLQQSSSTGTQEGREGGELDRQDSYSEVQLALPTHIDTDLVPPLDATPASFSGRSPHHAQTSVLTCLDGLPQTALVGLCQAAAGHQMPLTVALACEKARQQAAGQDTMAWRDLVSDVLEATARAEAHPAAPLHVVGPWLEALLWLADARWRKLAAAAPQEQLQRLLDCLQGYVALPWLALPCTPASQEQGLFSGAAERLRLARSEMKARLNRGDSDGSSTPHTPPTPQPQAKPFKPATSFLGSSAAQEDSDSSRSKAGLMGLLSRSKEPAVPASDAQPKAGRFANLRSKLSKPSDPDQETRHEDSHLGSKLTGFKNRLLRPSSAKAQQGLESSYRAGSGYLPDSALGPAGPSPSPLDSAYDFGALAEDRKDAGHDPSTLPAEHSGRQSAAAETRHNMPSAFKGHSLHYYRPGAAAGEPNAKANLTDRVTGNLRKAMGMVSKEPDATRRLQAEAEVSPAAAEHAHVLVQLAFAAFAVSAYIRFTLCPALQGYEPQPRNAHVPVNSPALQLTEHALTPSAQQQASFILQHAPQSFATLSRAAVDSRHAEQTTAAQAEFDSLEEVYSQCSLLAGGGQHPYHPEYFTGLHSFLQESLSVEQFQQQLQSLLLPSMSYLSHKS